MPALLALTSSHLRYLAVAKRVPELLHRTDVRACIRQAALAGCGPLAMAVIQPRAAFLDGTV